MKEPIYLSLANKIESMIENDIYKIGDKLPSLRRLQRENSISLGTVLQAFNQLIDKGLISSREKSGYFVSHQSKRRLPVPQTIPVTCLPVQFILTSYCGSFGKMVQIEILCPLQMRFPIIDYCLLIVLSVLFKLFRGI